MPEGRLIRSEVETHEGHFVILPLETAGERFVQLWANGVEIRLTPEDAHYLGGALQEHAAEAGFDVEAE